MKQKNLVIGYIKTKNLFLLRDRDIHYLDVINLAFAAVKDHAVTWNPMGQLDTLKRAKALNPDLKIVLSIGGWGSGGFSEAASTKEGREVFAESAVALMREYGLDGLDIDWEYPCVGIAGIDCSANDKENFTLLIKKLREELDAITDRVCTLSIAAGGDSYYLRCTQMDQVAEYLDYIMLMTYDLRGGFSVQTGHHTNLYTNNADLSAASTDYTVSIFEQAGVAKEKLVIGAAFYSRIWRGVPDRNRGLVQMAETTGGYGPDYGMLVTDYIDKNGYKRYWDEEAKAPYLFNGCNFISYDDKESIQCKINYIKDRNLAGIMFWEYSQDGTHTLIPLIAEKLKADEHE
ncbi:MAG: glycoside hydrolase family 18 protein [Hungatella sp.]|jgi:chitinase|nr:glycoside hydrolase family 18 protein [Hungatella sp.]